MAEEIKNLFEVADATLIKIDKGLSICNEIVNELERLLNEYKTL